MVARRCSGLRRDREGSVAFSRIRFERSGACGDQDVDRCDECGVNHFGQYSEKFDAPILAQATYVHSEEARHAATMTFGKFHERDAGIKKIKDSSLEVVGWATAHVRDWESTVAELHASSENGNLIAFKHEPTDDPTPDAVVAV